MRQVNLSILNEESSNREDQNIHNNQKVNISLLTHDTKYADLCLPIRQRMLAMAVHRHVSYEDCNV